MERQIGVWDGYGRADRFPCFFAHPAILTFSVTQSSGQSVNNSWPEVKRVIQQP
ncbi:MAG: hypothetical protein QNJ46_24285 [Leptolyngbyaceae cyanobacterium MO_188.B28]|nr:hypothetical protein [Leptolyngbyaceae cyanobacterium MO_188.B28]